jgi:hypothetical protein
MKPGRRFPLFFDNHIRLHTRNADDRRREAPTSPL